MTLILNGTTGITSPGGDTSTSLATSGLSIGGVSLGAGNATRFKNRIINGDCRIDQRNAGASVTCPAAGSGAYTLDRWFIYGTQGSKFTVQQNAGSVTPPAGYSNYLGVTSSSAYTVGSGEVFFVSQFIEGFNTADLAWGTANAKTVTLSFQVYSSLTGTFGGSLENSAFNYSYPFSYSIPVANTWTTISITIAGPTAGTWIGATNGIGIRVYFGLGVGSSSSGTAGSWAASDYRSATGATSVVGTNGATFYITGVQLEVGSSATGFEYVDYTTQLAMCQRYYQKTYASGTVPGSNAGGSGARSGTGAASSYISVPGIFPVVMRASPTVTLFSQTGTSGTWTQAGGTDIAASSIGGGADDGFWIVYSSGLTTGAIYYGHWTAVAEL